MRLFMPGQRVMIQNYRDATKWVPGQVIKTSGPVSYVVETDTREIWRRHVDQLRKCSLDPGGDQQGSILENKDRHSWIVNPEESVESQDTGQVSEECPIETPVYSRDTNTSEPLVSITRGESITASEGQTQSTEVARCYPSRIRRPPDRLF